MRIGNVCGSGINDLFEHLETTARELAKALRR